MLHYYIQHLPPGSNATATAGKHVKDFAIAIDETVDAAASAAVPAPPLAVPVQANLAPVRSDKRVRAVALGLALMAHAAVLYVLAHEPERDIAGSGGQQIDAISVTIVSSSLLESRQTDQSQSNAPAAADMVEANDGTPDREPTDAAQRSEEKKAKEEPRERHPVEEPIRTAEAVFEVPKEAQRQRKQEAAAPAGGGAEARSDTASDAKASAPAAATAGAARAYSRNVVEALRKTRPKAVREFGTVRVKFRIAEDGGVDSAEIAKSSGNKKLDDIVLEAVRQTKFQTPPAGMTSTQRFYELPYYFR
jgi:TonB family protein